MEPAQGCTRGQRQEYGSTCGWWTDDGTSYATREMREGGEGEKDNTIDLDEIETLFTDGYHRGAVKIAGLRVR